MSTLTDIKDLDRAAGELEGKKRRMMGEAEALIYDDDGTVRSMTDGQTKRFDNLTTGIEKVNKELEELNERRRDAIGAHAAAHPGSLVSGDGAAPYGSAAPSTQRDASYTRARQNIEGAARSGLLPGYAAERATALIEQGPTHARSLAARWAAAAGAEHYRTAFGKLLSDPERGHLLWSPQELDAYREAVTVNAELQRAMSTTGANGGYMIPLSLDPAIMLTNDGSNNPLRQLARVVQTATNTWQGVTSAGASAEWKTEAAEVADGSPTLGSPSIPIFTGDSFVPYSFEVGMDALDFQNQLSTVLNDAAANLQATAYTTGNGTTAPQGIVTGLIGTASEINGTGTEALDDSDPFALQNALPARFSAGAVFMSHIATANAYRQMETTNGAHQFPELRQNPPYLLGKRWHENSNMDSTTVVSATANNYLLIYGDIRAGFVIADRIGSTLELIPNLMGANGRPTGERGALLWFRTGSEVVVPQALRMLDIPTTA